jgi:hypothetical protein
MNQHCWEGLCGPDDVNFAASGWFSDAVQARAMDLPRPLMIAPQVIRGTPEICDSHRDAMNESELGRAYAKLEHIISECRHYTARPGKQPAIDDHDWAQSPEATNTRRVEPQEQVTRHERAMRGALLTHLVKIYNHQVTTFGELRSSYLSNMGYVTNPHSQSKTTPEVEALLAQLCYRAGVQLDGYGSVNPEIRARARLSVSAFSRIRNIIHESRETPLADATQVVKDAIAGEVWDHNQRTLQRVKERDFDGAGARVHDEVVCWSRKNPTLYAVLAGALRAPKIPQQDTVPERPRAVQVRSLGGGAVAAQPRVKADLRRNQQSDMSLLQVDKKNLRVFFIGSIISNTNNPQVHAPMLDNNANVLFQHLTVEGWRYLNTLGVVPSYSTFVSAVHRIVKSEILKLQAGGNFPVFTTVDNLDFDGAPSYLIRAMMHLITTQHYTLPRWQAGSAECRLSAGDCEMQSLGLSAQPTDIEMGVAYARMYSAKPEHLPELEKLGTQFVSLAHASEHQTLREQVTRLFDSAPAAAEDVINVVFDVPISASISSEPDFVAAMDHICETFKIQTEASEGELLSWRRYHIVAGDQESFEMMQKLKRKYPVKYAWLLPWPGDLHISMNFARTILNSNNWQFLLKHLGIAAAYGVGNLNALESGAKYQQTKTFLTAVYFAGLREMRTQYDADQRLKDRSSEQDDRAGSSAKIDYDLHGRPVVPPTLTALRAWAAEKGKTDLVIRKCADLVLRDLYSFVALEVAVRTVNMDLRIECIRAMAPLFFAHGHPKYVKLIAEHIRDWHKMPKAYKRWARAAFSGYRSQSFFTAQSGDELHETCINLSGKGALKRIDENSEWMKDMVQYLAASVQMSILWLEQTLHRRDGSTQSAPLEEQASKAQHKRELCEKVQREMAAKQVFSIDRLEAHRPLESPWDETVKSKSPADADDVLEDYSRGEQRMYDYVTYMIFGAKRVKVSHKPPIKLVAKKRNRTVLKKRITEVTNSYKMLKQRIAHGLKNGLNLDTILTEFQSTPFPLALCSALGLKHDSGKSNANMGVKAVLTDAQQEKHVQHTFPEGEFVYSMDLLTELYRKPSATQETFQKYIDSMIDIHILRWVQWGRCRALICSFDKQKHMPETKIHEQAKRRTARVKLIVESDAWKLADNLDERIPRVGDEWTDLCSNHAFREQLIRAFCKRVAERMNQKWGSSNTVVILDGHCMGTVPNETPVLLRAERSSSLRNKRNAATFTEPMPSLSNHIGESDLAVLYLAHRVAGQLEIPCVILASTDTDVWVSAVAQGAARYGALRVFVHRPKLDEFVDIIGTAEVLAEAGIGVDNFVFLFALCGTDFTSGIAGFTHTSVLKHFKANKPFIEDLATRTGADALSFSAEAFERLIVGLYYDKYKGGANAVNFLPDGDSTGAVGPTLASLISESLDSYYDRIRTVVHEHSGQEAHSLPRKSAMIRHAARAEWTFRYWHTALSGPSLSTTTAFKPIIVAPTTIGDFGVAGWVKPEGASHPQRGQLQMAWDEGVTQGIHKGCGCCGGQRGTCGGNCGCKGAGMLCGAYCSCQGGTMCCNPKNAAARNEGGGDGNVPAAAAAAAPSAAAAVGSGDEGSVENDVANSDSSDEEEQREDGEGEEREGNGEEEIPCIESAGRVYDLRDRGGSPSSVDTLDSRARHAAESAESDSEETPEQPRPRKRRARETHEFCQ